MGVISPDESNEHNDATVTRGGRGKGGIGGWSEHARVAIVPEKKHSTKAGRKKKCSRLSHEDPMIYAY